MKKIFVSYTTMCQEINIDNLEKIKLVLENYGCPYIELLDNNSLKTQDSIINELKNSDLFILLRTDFVDKSNWVQLELGYAYKLKIPIIEIDPYLLLNNGENYLKTINLL